MDLSDDFPLLLAAARAREGLNLTITFDPQLHPRDPHGKFAKVLGGLKVGESVSLPDGTKVARGSELFSVRSPRDGLVELRTVSQGAAAKKALDVSAVKLDEPIDVGADVEKAAKLLAQGKRVNLDQPRTVSTLLDELKKRTLEAEKLGNKAPDWDLCGVTVKNTNLFCVGSKGIDRIDMPQLKGRPGGKGTPKVDLSEQFVNHLEDQGLLVHAEEEGASYLRPTQREINGAKVAGMVTALRAGKSLGDDALFVSSDNYIVDGHHRWAAHVGVDTLDNELGDIKMDIYRVDADIIDILRLAKEFAKQQGMPQAGF